MSQMLPKPKFDTNLMSKQTNNGLQLAHNWFQCSGFESRNELFVNNYNESNHLSNHFNNNLNQNNYNNNRNNGQKRQNYYQNQRFNNNNNNSNKKVSFDCESCCRSFPTQDRYKTHVSQHVMVCLSFSY